MALSMQSAKLASPFFQICQASSATQVTRGPSFLSTSQTSYIWRKRWIKSYLSNWKESFNIINLLRLTQLARGSTWWLRISSLPRSADSSLPPFCRWSSLWRLHRQLTPDQSHIIQAGLDLTHLNVALATLAQFHAASLAWKQSLQVDNEAILQIIKTYSFGSNVFRMTPCLMFTLFSPSLPAQWCQHRKGKISCWSTRWSWLSCTTTSCQRDWPLS